MRRRAKALACTEQPNAKVRGSTTDRPMSAPSPSPLSQHPALRALFTQLAAALLVLFLVIAASSLLAYRPSQMAAGLLQGLLAALLGRRLGLPSWWLPINLLFVPALLLLNGQQLPPSALFAVFVLLLLLNWNSFRERVPLYLSGQKTIAALAERLQSLPAEFRYIDLGSGLAGGLSQLSRRFPKAQFVGVETAPLVFALAWLRCLPRANCQIRYRNLWQEPLAHYEVVYCFLSPAPMAKLWAKARAEMQPDALLISNSFAIPDVAPSEQIELHDWRASKLLIWRM
jgi:hypothetical protein